MQLTPYDITVTDWLNPLPCLYPHSVLPHILAMHTCHGMLELNYIQQHDFQESVLTQINPHTHKLRVRPCQSSMTYELVLISRFHFLFLICGFPLMTNTHCFCLRHRQHLKHQNLQSSFHLNVQCVGFRGVQGQKWKIRFQTSRLKTKNHCDFFRCFFYIRMRLSSREQVLFCGLRRGPTPVAPPCFYSCLGWTDQTLAL